MNKRFQFIPYSFRSKLLLVLLLAALGACIVSAAGSFMIHIGAISNDLAEKEEELAYYLLGLDEKTALSTGEMLSVTQNETLVTEIASHPERLLSTSQIAKLEQGSLQTVASGFTAMPVTYISLNDDVISIRPSRDFNLFLSILPRVAFTIILSLVMFALMAVLVSFFISKPVTQLTQATRQISQGNFSIRLPDNNQGEIGELMRSFNSMAEELEKTDYLQKDFISSVSHEFRTPIASIKGFARLLQMPGVDEASRQEYVGLIAQESDRLSRLSDTLLRLSALEHQMAPASVTSFRLDEQVRQVILQLEPTWSAHEINWKLRLDPVIIESDADLLVQVWINLIQNAVKFSPQGSTVEMTVRRTNQAEVIITDHGIGMSDETLSRIFERFYQGDSSRSKEGVGLGLCLVKRIIHMLGGTIRVQSKPGEGSTFQIKLPLHHTTTKGEANDRSE